MGALANYDDFLSRFSDCQLRPSGPDPNQRVGFCPIHKRGNEKKPSLMIGREPNGKYFISCRTGCDHRALLAFKGLTEADLYPPECRDPSQPLPQTEIRVHDPAQPKQVDYAKWEEWNAAFVKQMAASPTAKKLLFESIGVPESAFDHLPGVGACGQYGGKGPCWTFTERDGSGRIIGIMRRFVTPDPEKKRAFGSSKRGIYIPDNWQTGDGPLLLPEGESCTLAGIAAGLSVVGRPSNTGGVSQLRELLKDEKRDIFWLGENDGGAGNAPSRLKSERLGILLGRTVLFALPPDGTKDLRDWLIRETSRGNGWETAGCSFVAAIRNATGTMPRRPIRIEGNNEEPINDQVIAAITDDPALFARGTDIVTVLEQPAKAYRGCQFPPAPRIAAVSTNTLRERISTRVNFTVMRNDKPIEIRPPEYLVAAIRDRKVWPGMRCLESVVEYPVLRPDGTVIAARGYDEATGVFYAPTGELPEFPVNPTREMALDGWALLQEMICDFPFAGECHKAAWLAGLLTPLARFAFRGPAPMFLFDGNAPGAGKGLLADTIALPLTGQEFACTAYTPDDDEMQKRITSLALEGDRLILLDNIAGPFGGSTVDLVLTSVRWQGRILGGNTTANLPLFATWYGTGNNVQFIGDILRRICPCRLASPFEKPEERTEFRHANLRAWVKENRAKLLGAALTILRAYFAAGSPPQKMTSWGSYEEWSRVVRGAVIWLGLPDPAEAKAEMRSASHASSGAMETIVLGWHLLGGDASGLTCGAIMNTVFPEKPSSTPNHLADIADAILTLLPRPSPAGLGKLFLQYRQRRLTAGRYLDFASRRAHTTRWCVKQDNGNGEEAAVVGVVGFGGDSPQLPNDTASSSSIDSKMIDGEKEPHQTSPPPPDKKAGTGFAALDD